MVVSSEALPRHVHLGDVAGDEVLGLGADEDADGAAGDVRGHGGTVNLETSVNAVTLPVALLTPRGFRICWVSDRLNRL